MNNRIERLRARMRERSIEALLISAAANRRYISGFSGSNGALLVTQDAALIFTDFRYRAQVAREAPAFGLREISTQTPLAQRLAATAAELGLRRIAFEAGALSVAQHRQLLEAFNAQFGEERVEGDLRSVPTLDPSEGVVEALRAVKDAGEQAILRRAIAITDAAFEAVLPQLTPEHTERQAAWMFEVALRERGADGVAFPLIVAAGPNAALPHAHPGDDPLGAGRPIVIDMGALRDGYHADLTRTIVLGEPDERFWQIYTIVLEAQRRAIAGLQAGITGAAADALARDYITASGFGDNFGHGLGHGVGLNIHEGPRLRDNSEPLPVGAIFSIEPGIYLEGWGGVRIEDLVLLRQDAAEVLSQARKLR